MPPVSVRTYRTIAYDRLYQELLAASSAGYLLKLIDGAQSYVENLATRPDPERLARVLKVFEEARSQLREGLLGILLA